MSKELPREHPSTYFVQDRSNQDEMDRLEIQDRMLTAGMGGVLPELSDPAQLRHVLDVGCGTGGWLIETARTYPTIKRLVGVDISEKMMVYARTYSETQDLNERVYFQATDALRALPFSDDYFDLVNQRLGVSWLRTWDWKKLLLEYQRVMRPGGIIRISEGLGAESNSPAFTRLNNIVLETFHRSGNLFTASSDGITGELARLMTLHGIQDVQTQVHALVYRAGTVEHQSFYEDMRRACRVALPFFQKWTRVPSDYGEICDQALKEMQQPDFVATATLLTAWGTRPKDGKPMLMRGLQ
jgi:ubiquinone/menaquinone biosynthesis C-methylase UbiE